MSEFERWQPASKYFQSFILLRVDVSLSVTAIKQAYGMIKMRCDAIPEVMLVSPDQVDYARHLYATYGSQLPEPIYIWSRLDFPAGQWCLGNFSKPTFFVGSKGS